MSYRKWVVNVFKFIDLFLTISIGLDDYIINTYLFSREYLWLISMKTFRIDRNISINNE